MSLLDALILGVVEGLTEFLPISSTGHMIVVGHLLGTTDEASKRFEIIIQLGAILAVCFFYRERLSQLAQGLWQRQPAAWRFAWHLSLAFLPAAVIGLIAHKSIKAVLFNPTVVSLALIAGGAAILWVERHLGDDEPAETELTWKLALGVGLFQTLALIPGVSRSGATILGGLWLGLGRKQATELSFFLAIPVMLAASLLELIRAPLDGLSNELPSLAVGFVTAFVVALLSIKWLLGFVVHHRFTAFAIYRIVLGTLVLTLIPR